MVRPVPAAAAEISGILRTAHEGRTATRWLEAGALARDESLAGNHELTELGADRDGRWVEWAGSRRRSTRDVRMDAGEWVERIEGRSEWRPIGELARNEPSGANEWTHLRIVPWDNEGRWPATVHVHAALDEAGHVWWAGLRSFRPDEDPQRPAEATVDIESDEETGQAVAWLAEAAAERLRGLRGDREPAAEGTGGESDTWPPELEETRNTRVALDRAEALRAATAWIEAGDGPQTGRLVEVWCDGQGRAVRWKERTVRDAATLDGCEAIAGATARATGGGTSGGENGVEILWKDTVIARGRIRGGVAVEARLGTRDDGQRAEWRRLAAWLLERQVRGGRARGWNGSGE